MRPNSEVRNIILLAEVAEAFFRECARALPNETGGVLVGRVDGDIATVHHAVGPGPKAKHSRASFTRDGEYAQDQLDALHEASVGHYDYLGEWHSHTAFQGPSPRDKASMAEIATSTLYSTPMPVLILSVLQGQEWTLRAYQMRRGKLAEVFVDRA